MPDEFDPIKYLEKANFHLADEINRLHEIIKEERTTNRMLLKRLGLIEATNNEIKLGEVNPIGGITPLRTRIRDLEAESRAELVRNENKINASEE